MNARTCVIFGGTGCIGSHFALHLLRTQQSERIYLADIRKLRQDAYVEPLRQALESPDGSVPRVVHVPCDVRKSLDGCELPAQADLIVNLAAVHREPGHQAFEYYETNIAGAENVCAYATRSGCRQIVFTSSISPYGSSDAPRNENSLTVPETPYGCSKLAAEKIHIGWQQAAADRRLAILRPGVVFGAGEHANVARLARSLARGYFVYMGNRSTRKAGVYVKELCQVVEFAVDHQEAGGEPLLVWNVSFDPPPQLDEYVNSICACGGFARPRVSLPRSLLVAVSYPLAAAVQLMGKTPAINPIRMRKLSQPTYIEPLGLRSSGYRFHFTMEQAMADWKQDAPDDFRS